MKFLFTRPKVITFWGPDSREHTVGTKFQSCLLEKTSRLSAYPKIIPALILEFVCHWVTPKICLKFTLDPPNLGFIYARFRLPQPQIRLNIYRLSKPLYLQRNTYFVWRFAFFTSMRLQRLTLSRLRARLVRVLSLAIHNNGLINMVSVAKWIYYVLLLHIACLIIQIGPLVAKLQHVTGMRGR